MLPPIAVVFPIFLAYAWYSDLSDSYPGLILLYTAFALPYVVWMMRGYLEDVPVELEEAALVDGCIRTGRAVARDGADGAQRPVRDRDLRLRLLLERVSVRAGADPDRT